MNELSEIIITIDTREKSQKRISSVESWGIKHGAVVEHDTLKLCDYKIEGTFRDHNISLGIEAKSYENFLSDSIDDIEDKLIRSFGQYKEVAFFIELGNYSFDVDPDDFHCTLRHSVPNLETTKSLAALEGFCDKMGYAGVHVRQLRGIDQFPYSLGDLLIYILRPHPPRIKLEDYKTWYLNHLMTYPDIGYVRAQKLMERYPNPSWLTSANVEAYQEAVMDYEDVLGKLTGKKLDSYIHNPSLETEAWRNNYFKNGSEIQPCKNCHSKQCQCSKNSRSSSATHPAGKLPDTSSRHVEATDVSTPDNPLEESAKTDKINSSEGSSHTATSPIQNTTNPKIADDRRGFSRTPYTPTPPAVTISKPKMAEQRSNDVESLAPPGFDSQTPPSNDKKCQFADEKKRSECKTPDHFKNPSHSIPNTKGKDPDMDDRQGQVLPPMIDPTADSDIVYHGGYTEIEPNRQSMQDPDLIKTNTHDKPGPATITKSKTTHKMSLKHHLVEWFENPHTLQETINQYGMKQGAGVGAWSGDRIFNMVVNSEKQGILRSYPHNGTKMYVLAVKPDIELDVGV